MNDKRSNNVEIGNIFDSTVTFNQSQDNVHSINSQHIEYEIDHNTLATTPMSRHSRNAIINLTTMMVAAIALFADLSGLVDVTGSLSYFNISKVTAFFVLVPICLLVILVTHHDFWITKLSPGIAKFKKGKWYENLNNGEVASYIKRAKCIYPKCNGFVNVVEAPPKEKHNHPVVGICSVGGIRHTYTIDFNSIGYPQQFDWSLPDQGKKA